MRKKTYIGFNILLSGILLFSISSCEKRVSNNPFDKDCPKEVFTPSNFIAVQQGINIELSWKQSNTNISGFIISRNENGGTMDEVARVGNTDSLWIDNNINRGMKYGYQLVAYAAENLSNFVIASVTTASFIVTTSPASGITANSAILGGSVSSEVGSTVTEKGICYSTSVNPTTASNRIAMGSDTESFSGTVTGLVSNTTYYVRAYARDNEGTSYGTQISFVTLNLDAPIATTNTADNIEGNTATLHGIVNANGNSAVVSFEYGTTTSYGSTAAASQSPVTGNTNTIVSAGISGLTVNTLYHFRVNAVNATGTANGSDLTFITKNILPAEATTLEADHVTGISATLNGEVNVHGQNTTVSFEYGTTTAYGSEVTANQSPVFGETNTLVSADVNELSENTTYYFRIKAENASATIYGGQLEFKTVFDLRATVITLEVEEPTTNSAIFQGNVIDEGGSPVTERGIYLATSPIDAPENYRPKGSGLGIFGNKWYLSNNTEFYIKAYAINSSGIAFGELIKFTCPVHAIPAVETKYPSEITSNSALLGGFVTNSSESIHPTTEKGICYNTSPDPTIENNQVIMGSGDDPFSDTIYNLTANTRYYVRAYAINEFGISYGDQYFFNTTE